MKFTTAVQLITAAITAQTASVHHIGATEPQSAPRISSDAALAYFAEALGADTHNLALGSGKDTEKVIKLMDQLETEKADAAALPRKATLIVSLHGMEHGHDTTLSSKVFSTEEDIVGRISQQLSGRSGYEAIELAPEMVMLSKESNQNELVKSFRMFNEVVFKMWEQTKTTLGLENSRVNDKFFIAELSALNMMQKHHHSADDVFVVDSYALELVGKKIGVKSNTYQFAQQVMTDYMEKLGEKFDVYVVVKEKSRSSGFMKRSSELNEVFSKRAISGGACFSSEEACQVSTDNCQSHGVCTKSKSCWSCLCSATFNKTTSSTTRWSGVDCGKRDISASANLFLWTTLALLATLVGGIKLLVSVGNQELPGVLEQ